MTENEAINVLKMVEAHGCLVIEAKVKSIQALSEIQQYRAIGTVDEIQNMKDQLLMVKDMCKDYYEIGTIDEFKALKEKNEPKELAEHNFQDEVHHYLCPSCRSIVSCTQNYCEECGQALET